MTFNKQELLREAGYSEGDIASILAFGPNSKQVLSTTSASFTGTTSFVYSAIDTSAVFPDDAQLVGGFSGRTQDQVGADADIRLQNASDGETVAGPVTVPSGNKFERFSQSPVDYSPSSDFAEYQIELRSDGTNTVEIELVSAYLGVRL